MVQPNGGRETRAPSMTIPPFRMRATMNRLTLATLLANCVIATAPSAFGRGDRPDETAAPDLTKGGERSAKARHDWNLGATGMRGWMYCDRMVTTDARQILVTEVDAGSPADGVLRVGDVLLGVAGRPFSFDPRTEFGAALTIAESEAGGGQLTVTRWRAGRTKEVALKLPVLGSYSATAPFDCPKSSRILAQGCKALAERMAAPTYGVDPELDPIPRSINALALLASGESTYLPLVKREARWAADFKARSFQTWHYGYLMMLLADYSRITQDASVLPGLKRLAMDAATGQSAVGSWGHGFARPDGRLGGYGMMNAPGVPLTVALAMARAAGIEAPEVDLAIERSARLLRFYVGKGAVPYGDHHPWIESHEDNGKCGMAAVLFNLLGEAKSTEFFSRMSVASHGPERDGGHCGNYFNIVWALPGVVQSGPAATGAWWSEYGGWYFDLARRWDGTFVHQGPPELEHDSYAGWDCTGGYLLAYALPLKRLSLNGAGPAVAPQLDVAAAHSLVLDGRGWSNKDRESAYDRLGGDQLIDRLRSWSPVVRERAAMAIARRKEAPLEPLLRLLESPALESRYGACQALAALGKRAAPAVEALRKSLTQDDLWLRVKAAEALARIGAPALPAAPQLLELLAAVDEENDPRGMLQRYLSFALFDDDGGLLCRSLDGVDLEALQRAVRAALKNQDGRARGSIRSVYRNLTYEQIKPLLPAIHQAVIEPAPSGEMFADTIRVEGLRLLAKHGVREGIEACVSYTRHQNPWDSQERTPELMKVLLSYGTHAKSVLPELAKIADYFEKDEPDFPKELMARKAKCVRQTIEAIKASNLTPPLLDLE